MIMGTPPTLIRSVDRLHYKVKAMALMLVDECAKAGVPVIITQTYRTKETQQEYYSWGRSKVNPFTKKMTKVTNLDGVSKISRHQTGLAFDICINKPGDLYNSALLARAGRIGTKIGLTWGGSWKSFPDPPHFEIPPSQIDKFIIPEEDDEVPKFEVTQKEKEYGIAAIKRLSELGMLGRPEKHIANLEKDPSSWALWVVQVNIAEKLEGK